MWGAFKPLTPFFAIVIATHLKAIAFFVTNKYNCRRVAFANRGHEDLARKKLGLTSPKKVLLVNPAIFDIRLHWPKWQLPILSLQLGAKLLSEKADVKLYDFIHESKRGSSRKLKCHVMVDGIRIQKWRYGHPLAAFDKQLKAWKKEEWQPDIIYVEGFTTFWWEGVAEAGAATRKVFKDTPVHVIGSYADLAASHAKKVSRADKVVATKELKATGNLPALSLYEVPPKNWHLVLPLRASSNAKLIEHAKECRKAGVQEFSLLHPPLTEARTKVLEDFLKKCAAEKSKLRMDALGTICAKDLARLGLAKKLRDAGFQHIFLADDRAYPVTEKAEREFIKQNKRAVVACHKAGYKPRTDSVVAGLCIGRAGESLERRIRMATELASLVGSVIPWAFMPSPYLSARSFEEQNPKLYPNRNTNGLTYSDYVEFISLTAVLNSRYRDCSFDFLGDGLISRLLAGSIKREGWNPDESVKGPLVLPMRVAS